MLTYYKADPERITMDVFDGMIDAICTCDMMKRFYKGKNCFDQTEMDKYVRGSKRSKKREYPMDWVFDFSYDLSVPEYYVTHREPRSASNTRSLLPRRGVRFA
ncbi:MAG: hypothetical protein Q4A07_06335 [Coriobacteriales bacterium]|nr:hypothetical protein [Coriobacteriales bacterium]